MRHALIEAFEQASRLEYELKLRPDHAWIAIVQALAIDLRSIVRMRADAPIQTEDWLADAFENTVVQPHDRKLLAVAQNAFSTTDRDSLFACRVCLLSGARHMFDPLSFSIPSVALEGTVEDWASILEKLRSIEKSSISRPRRASAIREAAAALYAAKRGDRRDARVPCARLFYELSRCQADDAPSKGESSIFADVNGKRTQIIGGFLGIDVNDAERSVSPVVAWRAGAPEPMLDFFPSVDDEEKPTSNRFLCFCL